MKPLTYFLQTSMLSTDTESQESKEGEDGKDKVAELVCDPLSAALTLRKSL